MLAYIYRKSLVFGVIILLCGITFSTTTGYFIDDKCNSISLKNQSDNGDNNEITGTSMYPTSYWSWDWAVNAGGSSSDLDGDICVDENGNSYIIGSFVNTIKFFGTTVQLNSINTLGNPETFVAKLDQRGNWIWVTHIGGTISGVEGRDICYDQGNYLYITGGFTQSIDFGYQQRSLTLTSHGNGDVFVAKLDTNGKWIWAKQSDATTSSTAGAYGIDIYGDFIYVTGSKSGEVTFGNTPPLPALGTNTNNAFVAVIRSDGIWQWATQAGSNNCIMHSLDICSDNNCCSYITGDFNTEISFSPTITLANHGHYDAFIAKLDINGDWEWAKSIWSQFGDTTGNSICVDEYGSIYLTGVFQGDINYDSSNLPGYNQNDIFVAKLDNTGDWEWAVVAGGTDGDSGYGICCDHNGAYVTGYFVHEAVFGGLVTSQLGNDAFIATLDTTGAWQRVYQASSECGIIGTGVSVDDLGNIYVIGNFQSDSNFDQITLATFGNQDIFVAKIGNLPEWEIDLYPLEGDLYLNGIELFNLPVNVSCIVGSITFEVNISSNFSDEINHVDFYVDNKFIYSDSSAPFTWDWGVISGFFGKHVVEVDVIDQNGLNKHKSLNIFKLF